MPFFRVFTVLSIYVRLNSAIFGDYASPNAHSTDTPSAPARHTNVSYVHKQSYPTADRTDRSLVALKSADPKGQRASAA